MSGGEDVHVSLCICMYIGTNVPDGFYRSYFREKIDDILFAEIVG